MDTSAATDPGIVEPGSAHRGHVRRASILSEISRSVACGAVLEFVETVSAAVAVVVVAAAAVARAHCRVNFV